MQIKKNLTISTDEFYYDLFDGGYLDPYDICENEEDADAVVKALAVIKDFEESCNEQIEGFIR